MFLLFISAAIAVALALLGSLCWLVLYLFKVRKGKTIFRVTAVAIVLAIPLFVFGILPLLAASLIAHAGTRPQDIQLHEDPQTFGCAFEQVEFESRDGIRLSGWWMEGKPGQPVFSLSHGLFRNRQEVLERACALNRLGYGTLLFDFRTHGLSEGRLVSLGFHERLDVLGAYDFLRARNHDSIVLLGVSMGAVAVLEAASDTGDEVKAIVADSPFLNLQETVDQHVKLLFGLPAFPFSPLFIWNLTRINGFSKGDLDTSVAVHRLKNIPILLIYGRDDTRMPESTARQVYEAIPYSEKEIVFFEDAGHGAAWRTSPERYIETVIGFLERFERQVRE